MLFIIFGGMNEDMRLWNVGKNNQKINIQKDLIKYGSTLYINITYDLLLNAYKTICLSIETLINTVYNKGDYKNLILIGYSIGGFISILYTYFIQVVKKLVIIEGSGYHSINQLEDILRKQHNSKIKKVYSNMISECEKYSKIKLNKNVKIISHLNINFRTYNKQNMININNKLNFFNLLTIKKHNKIIVHPNTHHNLKNTEYHSIKNSIISFIKS